jgi:hypothetical protein
MRRSGFVCTLLLGLLLFSAAAGAAPLDPALQTELMALYDRYNKAMAAGRLADAMALRPAPVQAEFKAKGKKDRAELLAMAQAMTPDKVEPQRATLSDDGGKATIETLATKTATAAVARAGGPKAGTVKTVELTLTFLREGQAWKLDDLLFGMAPADIKACKDEETEPQSAYDDDSNVTLGGPIRRVEFRPDHTLVVVRVVDEETCLIMPSRAKLVERGFKVEALAPGVMVEVEAWPHRTDKQRAWVDQLTIQKN